MKDKSVDLIDRIENYKISLEIEVVEFSNINPRQLDMILKDIKKSHYIISSKIKSFNNGEEYLLKAAILAKTQLPNPLNMSKVSLEQKEPDTIPTV